MRVLSQGYDIDVDYESSSFYIEEYEGFEDEDSTFTVYCVTDNGKSNFIMANYKNKTNATNAIYEMAKSFRKYIIEEVNSDTITEMIDYDLDKPFNKINIKTLENNLYIFPQDA